MPTAEPTPAARGGGPGAARVVAVDALRGVVMVLMLLDHVRDMAHRDAMLFDPTDLSRTTTALFLTRFVTHFCAPVFVLLAGVSAFLHGRRAASRAELSRFLAARGLWLIVLELTVVHWGAFFDFGFGLVGPLQVIWAIGVSMLCLAALVHLPPPLIAGFAVAVIGLHNLLDGVRVAAWQGPGSAGGPDLADAVFMVLHQPGVVPLGGSGRVLFVMYPLLPWVGVMAAGYALGHAFEWTPARRRRFFLGLGAALLGLFVLLRTPNLYGDPRPWDAQTTAVSTALSFINVTKYPASLLFIAVTLGPALLALAPLLGWRRPGAAGGVLVTFGRVPLFFYLLQWPLAHGLGLLASALAGRPTEHLLASPLELFTRPPPQGAGFGLAVVYGLWALGVVLLYPACRWFERVKRERRRWWLSYL